MKKALGDSSNFCDVCIIVVGGSRVEAGTDIAIVILQ